MPFIYPTKNINLSKKTLVVPVVSTANVSQLAADLLIATLSLKRIAVFDASYFVPVVGGREDGEEGVTTPYELFGTDTSDVLVIQQRSPVLKSRKQDFVGVLLDFIKSFGFAGVLFLSGVDLSNRTDSQMLTPTYHIVPQNSPTLESSPLKDLLALPIPLYTSPVLQKPQDGVEQNAPVPFIPGGGLTRRILSSLPEDWPIPTAALLQFVLEGDNRADANLLAAVTAKVIGQDSLVKQWKQPSSWKEGLFGAPHDQTLYG
ncbi:PAC2 family-domain-containing protein [Crucibulum laeve]|uniref:Proteasome assembly chaperone 2 n=1 Tax=Crucibulum laeve TaxID=68775 RepID=A0A5C3MJ63_9AGAR|nr:PAC2 family-domain-containing protein [Crucibulum laeve]